MSGKIPPFFVVVVVVVLFNNAFSLSNTSSVRLKYYIEDVKFFCICSLFGQQCQNLKGSKGVSGQYLEI